jgi:hypothetical protein
MANANSLHLRLVDQRCGPGGIHCPCCGPPPGRARRKEFRLARRRAKKLLLAEAMKDMDDA